MDKNEIVTSDWSKFGNKEIDEAKELLSHVKEIDSYGEVKVQFNTHSGYVFLVDDDCNVWMMNEDKEGFPEIQEWFCCPYCGHEGFLEDMDHTPEDEVCTEYLKDIGVSTK